MHVTQPEKSNQLNCRSFGNLWKAEGHSADQGTPRFNWNSKIHYRVQRNRACFRVCATFRNMLVFMVTGS
jgi:hypothetical protein